MTQPKIIVCGCTKNSSSYIQSHLEKLYLLKSICSDFHMVIFENDSTDKTKIILEEFQSKHENTRMIFDTLKDKIKISSNVTKPYSRFVKKPLNLTYARNALLHYVETNYSHFDYMIMVDLDSVVKNFKPTLVQQILQKYDNSSWDVLTANSDTKYYDIWALRIYHDVWDQKLHGKLWKEPIDYDCWMMKYTKKYVHGNQINIPIDFPLIPVTSAFGGLGLYKISSIIGCRYNAEFDNSITCEHVHFHDQIIKKGGKIFICPDLVVRSQCRGVGI